MTDEYENELDVHLDIQDPNIGVDIDKADVFLHRYRTAANDNPPAHPAYFRLEASFRFMTAQEVFDLAQRIWNDEVRYALQEAWREVKKG